ncbi:CpsD/CapB family tyrosine-protein kinase [Clostridium sp. MSJ-11]|uniref:non-specific protein-tyrosine kinase n=1 Tax=Clostridium mobile TaxID=2841512 RepID=A0ABS6EL43_9CLOT|nr:CpsD/CapB family tyrosine-protein kinase [Clostridium mobile]MBU5485773.1 CpsD/CapB family tyrosine-protein kinase [Clostridium mobile]
MEGRNLITIEDPRSPIAEAYRTLRTNIQFSSFDKKIQSIVVTSSGPGEGKSTTSANLAIVMAQSGSKTILIDCDQRKSTVHKTFGLSNEIGISDLLVGKVDFKDAVQDSKVENLDILTAGTRPPNPSELLSSKKMKEFIDELREEYEYIIIDSPPIIAVTDAQLIASFTDGALLVISSGEVERAAAIKAKELLDKVNAKIIGIVLNKLEVSEKGYYGYYYQYYYGKDGDRKKGKNKSGEVAI